MWIVGTKSRFLFYREIFRWKMRRDRLRIHRYKQIPNPFCRFCFFCNPNTIVNLYWQKKANIGFDNERKATYTGKRIADKKALNFSYRLKRAGRSNNSKLDRELIQQKKHFN